ncbi:MAG TPA: response regulator [Clostridia bacterium]|nr:response regulator [Clostridia bacterium]
MDAFTILHVEDDPNDAMLVKRAFVRAKLPVSLQQVSDGQKAVDYLEGVGQYSDRHQFPEPQLVLLDLKLPALNGFEVLASARKNSRLEKTPIFILSSSDQPEDQQRAQKLGANRYLLKTAAFQDVVQHTSKLLGSQSEAARQ